MRIAVFGLGYVGTVCAAGLARLGHRTVGVDVDVEKVGMINAGRSPVREPGISALVREAVAAGRLRATAEGSEAVAETDQAWITVGTPSLDSGAFDLSAVERSCRTVAQGLRGRRGPYGIAIRSTLLPGTTRRRLIPLVEEAAGGLVGEDLAVAYYPEFLREGASLDDFFAPPLQVVGSDQGGFATSLIDLMPSGRAEGRLLGLEEAELVKVASNAWHAAKVVFANEIGAVARSIGVDAHRVMAALCTDRKLNLSARYLRPGFAFGGSCLPKDLRAILHHGRSLDLRLPGLEATLPSNDIHRARGVERILSTGCQRIGLLGLAFKADTDDVRESPLVALARDLLAAGLEVTIFDPGVELAELVGANRRYLAEHLPGVADLLVDSPEVLLRRSELLVVGNPNRSFVEVLGAAGPEHRVLDLVGLELDPSALRCRYEGFLW